MRQIQFLVNGSPRDPVPSTSPIPKEGLINGQENTIRVRSIDNGTTSPWSNEIKVYPEEGAPPIVGQADAKYRFEDNSKESYSEVISDAPNVTYQDGIYGREVVFNGNGYVNTGSKTFAGGLFCTPGKSWKVSLWGTSNTQGTYIARCVPPTSNPELDQRTFHLYEDTYSGQRQIRIALRGLMTPFDIPSNGVRRHLSVQWNGDTEQAHLFINNVKHLVPVGTAPENVNENIIIGARTGGAGYQLGGAVDEVNFFNEAQSDAENTELYNTPQNPMVPFLLRSTSAVAGDASITVSWNIRAGEVGSLTSVEWSLNDGDYEALPTALTGTEIKGTYLGNPIVNGTTYAVRIKAVTPDGEFISDPISVTPSPITSEPLAPDNPAYMEWYNEVISAGFTPPDQAGFREAFRDEILALVGFDPTEINIIHYDGYNSSNAKTAMNEAIDATPVGGTLLIPEGVTLRLNNFTISKKIRIDCRGTIKRCNLGVDGTTSPWIIALNANCLWDGGIIDANRESWGKQLDNSHKADERAWLIKVNARSVVRNVHGVNMCELTDSTGMQWAGFEINVSSYFENVICERNGGRLFRVWGMGGVNDATGAITTYNGMYFYKCEARDYQRKGFNTGATSGWVMLDDCKWNGMGTTTSNFEDSGGNLVLGHFRPPEDGVLLETGHHMELHNGVRVYYHNGIAYYRGTVNKVTDWYDANDNPKPSAAIVNDSVDNGFGGRRNHTAYFKDCTNNVDLGDPANKGWWSSKSDGYKFRIINNCNFKNYHSQSNYLNIHICGVSVCTVHADSPYYLRSVIAAFNSTFESYTYNDGVNITGNANFPFGEGNINSNSFKRGEVYFSDCEFTYNTYSNTPLRFSQRFGTFWAKNCIFNTSSIRNEAFLFFGQANTGLKMIDDQLKYYTENCHFNHGSQAYVYRKAHSTRDEEDTTTATYEVGLWVCINPTGNVNPDVIHDVSERNKVQRAVHNGNRVFVSQTVPTDGVGWREEDRIVNSLSNMNIGWTCTTAGTGGVDAVFTPI